MSTDRMPTHDNDTASDAMRVLAARVSDPARIADHLASSAAHLSHCLETSPRPQQTFVSLDRLLGAVDDPAALVVELAREPRLIESLVTLISGSQHLTEILLRDPGYLDMVRDMRRTSRSVGLDAMLESARECLVPGGSAAEQANALCRFQRGWLLRIGLNDLLGAWDVATVTLHLSLLAEAVLETALGAAARWVDVPRPDRGFCVLAFGKLGGHELNYSSDIDLVFVCKQSPERYTRLGSVLIEILSRSTPNGFAYRVDMRLRPWGSVGSLVVSQEGYLRYLDRTARVWEKQALIKARAVAGDIRLGQRFLRQAADLTYGLDADQVRHTVRDMKDRIEQELRRQAAEWGEVKRGIGSIRDVEFTTQYLQLLHGGDDPSVRSENTLDGLQRLRRHAYISQYEYITLANGYLFLRPIEHYLQMMDGRQTHRLPRDTLELEYLARRLGFNGDRAGEQFVERYSEQSTAIRSVYNRYLGETMMDAQPEFNNTELTPSVRLHLERMAPDYASTFDEQDIRLHAEMAALLDRDRLVDVMAAPVSEQDWRVTVVAYDYPGELSLICGLLFAYGFSIQDGDVFTYEPLGNAPPERQTRRSWNLRDLLHHDDHDSRLKIVDVFTVRPTKGEATAATWAAYQRDLSELLEYCEHGRADEARGRLIEMVSDVLRAMPSTESMLFPISLDIDNASSEDYTVLQLSTQDTVGFLFEFTNALALSGVNVSRVTVESEGDRVEDVFWLTDARGHKIESEQKQRELRAASVLVKHFTHLLPNSPNPEQAILHFREFLQSLFQRPDWLEELTSLERPEVLTALARLLGVSDFLWEDFLRMQHGNLFPVVRDVDALTEARTKEELETDVTTELAGVTSLDETREVINAFKDRETFRVDMRHIQGHIAKFGQFSAELSDVVEVVVEATTKVCYEDLLKRYGEPKLDDGSPCDLSVVALGKLGGREIGYASDIELMFIYEGNGDTTGPRSVSTASFYRRLVRSFLDMIKAKREGIFTIDLRLRPYGSAGSLAVSLESFERYFAPEGAAWFYERQALVKLRPITGPDTLRDKVVDLRDSFVFGGQDVDYAAIWAMRERQMRHLVSPMEMNAKYGRGDLVDVEYLVQAMQMQYGHTYPELRRTNTREAMRVLAEKGLLSPADYQQLRDAHIFLRHLIDALRMERGNARDLTVPKEDSDAFEFLARRLGYDQNDRLEADLDMHVTNVYALCERLLKPEDA